MSVIVPPWVLVTLAAVVFQTLRFAAQKRLSEAGLGTMGATLARFLPAVPLAFAGALAWAGRTGQEWPAMPPEFWFWGVLGGLAQILATLAVVRLFGLRAFAVGITLKKSEVVLTALAGWLLLGDRLPAAGLAAILAGFAGVLMLSDPPRRGWASWRALALGLGSGAAFAVSATGYRGAVLALPAGDTPLRALVTLAIVTALQAGVMLALMAWRQRGALRRAARAWRAVALTGALSAAGSFCWFAAFALERAAYVFAVGQVELLLSLGVSVLFFGERVTRREIAGMAVLTGSILALVALG